ncbi:hypothetical protein [Paraburkholderia caribensis]|uniref:hypothetical protein n=1 Tax=Paraburkholderia caribensis TaxID=75105 RepID=UPI0012E8CDE0|nr:hypothetical protein [Paraburkholderia caribensis]
MTASDDDATVELSPTHVSQILATRALFDSMKNGMRFKENLGRMRAMMGHYPRRELFPYLTSLGTCSGWEKGRTPPAFWRDSSDAATLDRQRGFQCAIWSFQKDEKEPLKDHDSAGMALRRQWTDLDQNGALNAHLAALDGQLR